MSARDPESEALLACRAMLGQGSLTFALAARFLPSALRDSATALYAFCRVADDAVDQPEGDPHEALADLYRRLDAIYAGTPRPHPADRAFAALVGRESIPKALPLALIEGFEWDVVGRRYVDIGDLEEYAARVAGTVGAMMALLLDVRDPQVVAAACDLGIGMQLTNIARDVGEDARSGRLYLPSHWMHEAGIDPDAWLVSPRFSPALGAVVERLLAHAEPFYRSGAAGIRHLPWQVRPGMEAARVLYREIGQALRRSGFDSVARRTVVGSGRKLWLALRASGALVVPYRDLREDPVRATRFVVDAAQPAFATPGRGAQGRIARVLEIFASLEARDQQRTALRMHGSR
jgi:15-cis-phytoene synthase